MYTTLLKHFGLQTSALIGNGSESHVYALDEARIVRIYRSHIDPSDVQARWHFYTQLAEQKPAFAIPHIYTTGIIDGHVYTIEQRMPGQDFAQALPRLVGPARAHALYSYLDLAAQIGMLQFPDNAYGELVLPSNAIHTADWPQYLWERIQANIRMSKDELAQALPQLEHVLAQLHTRLQRLEPRPAKSLVHGDYFPGNVFIDQSHTVYGVGDFGYSTLVGDRRMDLVGAIVFLELVDGYQASDTALLLHHLAQIAPDVTTEILELYHSYYALYFSGCKDDDPKTYAWCMRQLHNIALSW